METVAPESSASGAFGDDINDNCKSRRLTDSSRKKLRDWWESLEGRTPSLAEKKNVINEIHLNHHDKWYQMKLLNKQLKRWGMSVQKHTAVNDDNDLIDLVYPDISYEDRIVYKAFVEKYPNNYVDFLDPIRRARDSTVSKERILGLCDMIHRMYIVKKSGNNVHFTPEVQDVQMQEHVPGTSKRDETIEYQNTSNASGHLPTPSNSLSPEILLMQLPSESEMRFTSTEQNDPIPTVSRLPILSASDSTLDQLFSSQDTQSYGLGTSASIYPVAGVKRRRSASPPLATLSASYRPPPGPPTPSSIRSSESPFVAIMSFREDSPTHRSITNVSTSISSSSNVSIPHDAQRTHHDILFELAKIKTEQEIASAVASDTVGGRLTTHTDSQINQVQSVQLSATVPPPKTLEEFELWFSSCEPTIRQWIGTLRK